MLLTDSYGIVPGLTTSRETYEAEFRWGSQFQGVFANALISGSAIDSGNTPEFFANGLHALEIMGGVGRFQPYVLRKTSSGILYREPVFTCIMPIEAIPAAIALSIKAMGARMLGGARRVQDQTKASRLN